MDWGTLHLLSYPTPLPPELWADAVVNRILAVLAMLAALLVLRDYLRVFPLLAGCLVRSRGNIEIEHSVSQARARNRCALAGMFIFGLLADRYLLYPNSYLQTLPHGWRYAALLGVLTAYLLLRGLLALLLRKPKLDSESRSGALTALWNYFLTALPLMLLSTGLIWLFGGSDAAARIVFYAEIFIILLFTFIREGQILRSKYSPLQTFLYLCGLELIPLAALIVPGAVL